MDKYKININYGYDSLEDIIVKVIMKEISDKYDINCLDEEGGC